jgi:hypothetical protein
MHEKTLMLLVFLYIMASFRQKKVILRLTRRLIIIKIGPSFLALCQWPVVHWVAPCAHHLPAVALGHRIRSLHCFAFPMSHALDPRKTRIPQCGTVRAGGKLLLPIASGVLPACWPLQACHSKMRQGRQMGQMGRLIFGRSWILGIGFSPRTKMLGCFSRFAGSA